MDPFDDIQCEEMFEDWKHDNSEFPPDAFDGIPCDEPLTEKELEDQFQIWQEENRIISEEDVEQAR